MSAAYTDSQLERLVQKAAPQSRLRLTWPLKGGISARMTALEIEGPDSQVQKMILRQPGEAALQHNPRAAEIEFKLLQMTHVLGLATPAPYVLDASGEIFPEPVLVIEYIEGQPEFAAARVPAMVRQMAAELARIHSVDCKQLDFSFLPAAAAGFEEHFGEPPGTHNQLLDEGRVRDVLKTAWPIRRRNPPTLLHGDYWPGNLLWRNGQLAGVIDWEDAHVGDPLADLAISRLDIAWIFGRAAMDDFTRHYLARHTTDHTQLPFWDLYAALRLARMAGADLAGWAAFFEPFGRADITETTIREDVEWFVTQALAAAAFIDPESPAGQ